MKDVRGIVCGLHCGQPLVVSAKCRLNCSVAGNAEKIGIGSARGKRLNRAPGGIDPADSAIRAFAIGPVFFEEAAISRPPNEGSFRGRDVRDRAMNMMPDADGPSGRSVLD